MQHSNSREYISSLAQAKILARRLPAVLFGIEPDTERPKSERPDDLLREELQAQLEAIQREVPIRLTVLALMVGLTILFLPSWVVVLTTIGILVCDHVERLMIESTLTGGRGPSRALAIVAVFGAEFLFSFPSSLIWQTDEMFTKAVSIGIMAAAMMRLATIRAIHPATGFVGVLANAGLIAVFNSYYWLSRGQISGFVITTLIAVVTCGYVAAAITQNHRQRRMLALSRFELERVSEAKSRFLRQMSHELRTPLNAIIGLSTAAHLRTTEFEVRAQLGVLVTSAQGLGRVLDDVLDISAVEQGHIPLHERAGDPRREINLMTELFRLQAEQNNLGLTLTLDSGIPDCLRLDWDRLRQCLSNLISNSLRYVTDGTIMVKVGFDESDILWVEVADTGPGIHSDQREHLFRWNIGPDTSVDGHGLGLAICRSLARRMGGDVSYVERTSGAAFRISIVATPCLIPQMARNQKSEPRLPRGMRVLVVDDIGTNRLVASAYLENLGCAAIEVSSGADAIESIGKDPNINLVLLDISMPGMDGLETLSRIRALPGRAADIPVIAMTADASDRDRDRYLDAGMDGYVAKPIALEALEREIARVTSLFSL
jgi:two-component system, sensor histidine kinase